MTSLQLWLSATRPKTLFASISPVLIGTVFALSDGFFKEGILFLTLLTALLIQISTNYANDYFDGIKGADTENRKGPQRLTQAGFVSKKEMRVATSFIFVLTALCGCLLAHYGGPIIAVLTGLSLILALIYTAGPWPLAYLGLGDIFVLLFFGPIATSATYYLQSGLFSWTSFFAGFIPGCLSTAIIIVNNLRDVEEDKVANKKTLAVRFGDTFAKKEYITLLFVAYFVIIAFCMIHPFMLLALITIPSAIKLSMRIKKNTDKKELNPCLFETGKLLLYITMLVCIGKML